MRYYWEKTMRKDLKKDKMKNQVSDKKTELFDEEYIRKAEELEEALWADGDCEEETYTEEEINHSYEKLVNMLKEDGIYREDEPSEEKVIPMTRRKHGIIRCGKVAGVAILCCACIFAASMTSEANRNYFVNNIRVWSGNNTKTVVDNSEDNEIVNTDEYEAIEDIENQLGIEMPEFYYRPNGFEFLGYEVNTLADIGRIEYQYKDGIITFYVDKEKESDASKNNSTHGKNIDTLNISGEENEVIIQKTQDDKDLLPNYTAQWERGNVLYYLSGKIEYEEIQKILENIVF